MKLLSIVSALVTADVIASPFTNIERAINANVCDNWGDVDGDDFDVVGDGWDVGASPRGGRGGGGRGGGGRGGYGQHPAGRGGQGGHPMLPGGRGGGRNPLQGGMAPNMMPANAPHPGWLQNANPFGISAPIEGLIQLPMKPQDAAGTGTFSATVTSIAFLGRTQRPFRGERVVATLTRIGTTAATPTVRTASGIIVGVVPQQAQIGATNLSEWAGSNFGVRMAMNVAFPGNDITTTCNLVGTLTAPDTIVTDITVYGRYVG
jgi:hypothetical protein